MSKHEAIQKYIEFLTKISPGWESGESNSGTHKKEKWICSSTLGGEEEEYDDEI
jgi:hypothetical protein